MKSIKSAFWGGVLLALLLGVAAFVLAQIWNMALWLSEFVGFQFFKIGVLNTGVYLIAVVVALCILGWAIKVKFLRKGVDMILGKIPIFSWVVKMIPKGDEADILANGDLKEVRVEFLPGIAVKGLLIKSYQRGGKKYHTFYSATTPMPFTGYLFDIEAERVKIEHTGKTAADYFAYAISFGIRSSAE